MSLSRSESGDSQNSGLGIGRDQEQQRTNRRNPVRRLAEKIEQPSGPADDSTDEEEDDFVASAIDFLSEGGTKIHRSFDRAQGSRSSPVFACPVPSNGIRVVFYDTDDVFWKPPSEVNRTDDDTNTRTVAECETCVPSSDSQDDSTSRASFESAIASHVSPAPQSPSADGCGSLVSGQQSGASSRHAVHTDQTDKRDESRSDHSRESSRSSNSSPFLSSSFVERATWKRYPGGFSLDPTKVSQMWKRDLDDARLLIGVNLRVDLDDAFGDIDIHTYVNQIHGETHTMAFAGAAISFLTAPNTMRSSWKDHENTLEFEIRVFSLSSANMGKNAEQANSPLGDELWHVLCCKNSAMSLWSGDIDMGARLLTFDVLTATLICWLTFLDSVRQKWAWRSHTFGDKHSAERFQPLLTDHAYIADFKRSTRDLVQALDTTIESIKIAEKFKEDQKVKFRHLLLSHRTQREALLSAVKDIEDYMNDQATQVDRITHEGQDASLRRLTLVASIFLPLTTASSLLSMTSRVRDVGVIWWDWLGIVVTIGFVVVVGYSVTSGWQDFWHKPLVRRRTQGLRQRWDKAKDETVASKSKTQGSFQLMTIRQSMLSLIPTSTRVISQTFKYVLVAAIVSSFMIGMFVDVPTGAEALGYSFAGTLPAVAVAIVLWKILKFIVVKSWARLLRLASRVGRRVAKEAESLDNSQSPRDEGQGEETNEEGQPHGRKRKELSKNRSPMMLRILLFILKPVVRCVVVSTKWILVAIYKVMYWTFTLFFGEEILLVVRQMIVNSIRSYNPSSAGWKIRGFIDGFTQGVRGSDDRERSRSRSRSQSLHSETEVAENGGNRHTRQDERQPDREGTTEGQEERETITQAKA